MWHLMPRSWQVVAELLAFGCEASHVDLCKLYARQDGSDGCQSFVPVLSSRKLDELRSLLRKRETSLTSAEALFADYKRMVLPELNRFIGRELSAIGKGRDVATNGESALTCPRPAPSRHSFLWPPFAERAWLTRGSWLVPVGGVVW